VSVVEKAKPAAKAKGTVKGITTPEALKAAGIDAFKEVFAALTGDEFSQDNGGFSDFNGLYIGPYGKGPEGVKAALPQVRFGDVLTTTVVAATLLMFRAANDITVTPQRESTITTYDTAVLAARTSGYMDRDIVTMSYIS